MKGRAHIKTTARSCYGHLGGELGNRLFKRLMDLGWFAPEEGRSTVYRITDKGYEELERLGVDLEGFGKEE
jgi:DNA-binding PadR family transcriptional regulator